MAQESTPLVPRLDNDSEGYVCYVIQESDSMERIKVKKKKSKAIPVTDREGP
jgi:hypothetical protein